MKQYEKQTTWQQLFATLCSAALIASCGSATTTTGDTGAGATTTATAETSTAATVPSDLVLSSPTAGTSSTANLAVGKSLKVEDDSSEGSDFASKKEALQALIEGDGACSFTPKFTPPSQPACYGPAIAYSNHPDGSGGQSLPTGDTGIWSESVADTGEACAAAQMNYLIDKVATRVDNMVSLFGAMACAGRKASVTLPAVGETVNMLEAMTANVSLSRMTITAASVTRQADDADGNPVYFSTLAISIVRPDDVTESGTIYLKHILTAADNSTYKGKLSMVLTANDSAYLGNCSSSGLTGLARAGVVSYSKTSASNMVYALDYADFCGQDTNPFDSNYDIDASNKLVVTQNNGGGEAPPQNGGGGTPPAQNLAKVDSSTENLDGWGNNWNHGIFQLNPADGTGSVAFAWQAGAMDGYTRVLNVTVAANADGSAGGNAYFGFGPDVAEDDVGSISGFFCNWAGPNGHISTQSTPTDLVQRQVLERAVGGTMFTSNAAQLAITYAPTISCSSSAGANFQFYAAEPMGQSAGTEIPMDNNVTTANTAVTHNLITTGDMSFTVPTAPTGL